MRQQLVASGLAATIAWIWFGFLVAGAVAWCAYRWWRGRRPIPPPAPQRSYSQGLAHRLTGKRAGLSPRHKARRR